MRIVYVGNFQHSWSTETHVARDAERIEGVTVKRVQEPAWVALGKWDRWGDWLVALERDASEADVLLYQRTWGMPPEAVDLWRRLEARGVRTVSYHLDLYRGLKRQASVVGDPFWSTGSVFTADGDPQTQAWLESFGIDHHWLPAAVVSDETILMEGQPLPGATADVVFVGSSTDTYHPEWKWRGELLRGLRARYGHRFRKYPVGDARLHGSDLNRLYGSVPAVVGDSLALPGHTNYWSDRYYETVGRGGFLVAPNVPGIEAHFSSGDHLALYEVGDLAHVCELVDEAIHDRDAARSIARAGQLHVREHHTYVHRMMAMLNVLGFPTSSWLDVTDAEAGGL